jgi:circadian clock protein KaiB
MDFDLARTGAPPVWELRLYVAGISPKCLAALARLEQVCEECTSGAYRVEMIDVLESSQLPAVMRRLPAPLRQVVADLRGGEGALVGLDLQPACLD